MDYTVKEKDYELKEEVGHGASAVVYRAIYLPTKEVVAVKCLDLERCSGNLDDVRREAQTMSLIDHPNLIRAYCSFVVKQCLWVVMPYMAQGSCLHLMKIGYTDGFDEPIICSILKETLKALVYLHRHGHIHRDVKAGNILFDTTGSIKLGDFGVSAFLYGNGDRQRTRNTFVGTPCWMAPEVLQPGNGYDFKADIWSFGITALELAHGHAPFSKFPPMKVLLMTIQNAPPGLDYDRDKKFSKSFKEMVATCLVKDQTKRPTAEKLLKHSFFKNVKSPEITVKKLLTGLPPLWDRVRELQLKDAAALASKKMSSAEQMSQSEYKRGVSAWIFDIEDLKIQASLIQEDEVLSEMKEEYGGCMEPVPEPDPSLPKTEIGNLVLNEDDFSAMSDTEGLIEKNEVENERDEIDLPNTSSHIKNNVYELSRWRSSLTKISKKGPEISLSKSDLAKNPQIRSSSISSASIFSHSFRDGEKISSRFGGENQSGIDGYKHDIKKLTPSFSGPLMLPKRASENSLSAPTASVKSSGGYRDTLEEKSRVQIKGRFSVTSEDVDIVKGPLKNSSSNDTLINHKEVPADQFVKDIDGSRLSASLFVPYIQNLYQQTSFQLDLIKTIQNSLEPTKKSGGISAATSSMDSVDDVFVEPAVSERERLLLMKISELQARVSFLTEDLTATKIKYGQLQQQLASTNGQGETNRT